MEEKHGGLIRAARAQQQPSCRAVGNALRGVPRTAGDSSTSPDPPKSGGPAYGMFVAPWHGMEQIAQAITDRLPSESVRLRTTVEEVCPLGSGQWKIVTRSTGSEPHGEIFDAIVVAAPAYAAARLLQDAAPALSAELAAIDYTSCVVVNLAFSRDQIRHGLNAFGFVTPLIERRQVTACTFSSIKYPGRAPDGWCLLRAYLGGAANPAAVDSTDHEIRHAALADLTQLLKIRGEPSFVTIRRHRRAMPQYELGHLARVDQIERLAARLPGLALAGNAYHGGGVAHCIHSGELAAERVAAHLQHQAAPEMARS
jgi:oxygen-dependent protoporphyrinogen oxidase